MSIYPGDSITQNYADGLDRGYAHGETDLEFGLGAASNVLRHMCHEADVALTRESRAFALGVLRGYREAVRTLKNGRWGV